MMWVCSCVEVLRPVGCLVNILMAGILVFNIVYQFVMIDME